MTCSHPVAMIKKKRGGECFVRFGNSQSFGVNERTEGTLWQCVLWHLPADPEAFFSAFPAGLKL